MPVPPPETENDYEEIQVNGQWYYFGMKFTNSDGYEIKIHYQNLQSFELTDNILNWGHTAILMYDSQENAMERKPNPYQDPPPEETEEKYIFRNDKRDTVLIHLEPAPVGDQPDFPPTHTFDMEFVVVDRKKLEADDPNRNFTVLALEEMDIQQMFERSIEWSTATALLNPFHSKEQTRMHDDEREMQTGLAIKDILELTERKWDGEYWDDGITREFYSSYGNESVGNIISHMLRHHLSEAAPHDICLFWKDRVTQLWRLWPLSKFCEKAGSGPYAPGEWEYGHGFIQTHEDDIDQMYDVPFSPQYEPGTIVDDVEKAVGMNNIPVWTYSDTNIQEADKLNSPLVLTARDKRKMFYYDTTGIPQNVEDFINENYTSKKYVDGLFLSVPYNLAQKTLDNKQLDWSMHPDKYGRRNDGLVQQVWRRLMHTGCAIMTVKGSTHYRAGVFFGVDAKSFQETKFDYRQYGTWFAIQCKFILRGESSMTQFTMIKPEAFRFPGVENGLP